MNVVVGDNTGLLKVVSLKTDGPIKRFGSQDAARGAIDAMNWAGLQNPEAEVAIGLRCGKIEVWNTLLGELSAEIPAVQFSKDMHEDKFVGLEVLRNESARVLDPLGGPEASRVIVSATKAGVARVVPWYDAEQAAQIKAALAAAKKASIKPSVKAAKALAASAAAAPSSNSDAGSSEYQYASGVEWSIGAEISKMRVSRSLDAFVAGGRNTLMSLWDIETQEKVFKARSLPNDWLNLAVENHDLDYAFMPAAETGSWAPGRFGDEQTHAYKVVSVTGYKQVRLYDLKASQRPVMDVLLEKHAAHSVACTRDANYVIVGDGVGRIQLLDTRFNLRPVGILRGAQGSTRSLSVHHTLPMVASVGLDRYLRVHDLQTRETLKAVYLKQKLNCCLFSAVEPAKNRARSTLAVKDSTFDRNKGDEAGLDALSALDAAAGAKARKGKKAGADVDADGDVDGESVWADLERASKDRKSAKNAPADAAAAANDDNDEAEAGDDDELDFDMNAQEESEDYDEDFEQEQEQEYETETVAASSKSKGKAGGSKAGASAGADKQVKRGANGGKTEATKKSRR